MAAEVMSKVISDVSNQYQTAILAKMGESSRELKQENEKLRTEVTELRKDISKVQSEVIYLKTETMVQLSALKAMLGDLMNTLASGKRQPKTTTGAAADPAVVAAVGTVGGAPVAAPVSKFHTNSMLWAKAKYHEDEAFRTWVTAEVKTVCPTIEEDIKKDPGVVDKKEGEQKNRAIMTALWVKIRESKSLKEKVDQKYNEAKALHNSSNQQTPQTADAPTPDKTV
jgi:FtsZ-binding cell division protein ZapB